jgi:WD40 repeat protein
LATGSVDQNARLWETATGRGLRTLVGHTRGVQAVRFSPDGKTLATGSGSIGELCSDSTVIRWDVATGRRIWQHQETLNSILSVAFSPDGKLLATGGLCDSLQLLDAATGRPVRAFPGSASGSLSSLVFSPRDQWLAAGNWDSTVRLREAGAPSAPWKLARTLRCASAVVSVDFSADGRRLVTGTGDGTVTLWDMETSREILTLTGPRLDTLVALSPDSRHLAAASLGRPVMLWEAASREEVAARDAREHSRAELPGR